MGIQTVSQSLDNEGRGSPFGFKNRIINGDMRIDQRRVGTSAVAGAGSVYHVDRWLTYDGDGGSHYTIGQNLNSITPPTGFTNYLGIQTTTSYSNSTTTNSTLTQYIEGFNTADLMWGTAYAKTITVSFWVRSSLTGTFAFVLSDENYTANYVNTYTINQANTWEYKTITVDGPKTMGTFTTGNSRGLDLRFDLNMGTNFNATTAGVWQSTPAYSVSGAVKLGANSNATWYLTGVQLEVGKQSTAFDYRPLPVELQLCLRYYEKTFSYDAIPQNGTTTTEIYEGRSLAVLFAGHRSKQVNLTYPASGYRFKVTKRTSPTITIYGNNGGYPAYRVFSDQSTLYYLNSGNTYGITGMTDVVYVGNEFTSEGVVTVYAHFTANAEL